MMPGPSEIIVIILAIFILFGGKRLPEFARQAGKWMRKFQQTSREIQREINMHLNDDDEPKKPELKG
jgi:sec-independent protein translocase protein TatA